MRGFRAVVAAAGALVVLAPAGALAGSLSAQRSLRNQLTQGMRQAAGAGSAYVLDLTARKGLFSSSADAERLPASVEKLYTTFTALTLFGPNAHLKTSALITGWIGSHDVLHGTLYLRGGGDPTFGSASFDSHAYGTGATVEQLAHRIRQAGITAVHGRILGDESYFDSLRGTIASGYKFSSYVEGSLSALAFNRGLVNGGTAYVTHPATYAAQRLASALRAAGVSVPSSTKIGAHKTPASAKLVAAVSSPRIFTLISLTNAPSDNFFAEMLLKGIGAKFGHGGTSGAGAAVVRSEVTSSFGIHPHLDDGSGLSREDHTSPHQVVTLLKHLANDPHFVHSLAIAGETGTLANEMHGTYAQGRCRGKTGTLPDVANLAGYCHSADGHTLAFAFLINAIGDPSYVHGVEANMGVAVAKYNG